MRHRRVNNFGCLIFKSLVVASIAGAFALGATRGALASYVLQGPKLTATDIVGNANQGQAVAVSADGNTAAVGGQNDNGGAGAVWVWIRTAGVWSKQAKLLSTGGIGAGGLGSSVAISADGNTVVAGSPNDATGAGAVFVFVRSNVTWTQQGLKLVGTGAVGAGNQGSSVAISADGTTLLSGAPNDNTGVGTAFAFIRVGNVWTQQGVAGLTGTGNVGASEQGYSVALSADGNTALIGGATDNTNAGAAWAWTRALGTWTQQGAKLVGTGAVGAASQGIAVALSVDGNIALVGGPEDAASRGAVWAFARSNNAWAQQGTKFSSIDAVGGSRFGKALAVSSDASVAAIGGSSDNGGAGAVWIFARSGTAWSQYANKLTSASGGGFGTGVALSADYRTLLAGAPNDLGGKGSISPRVSAVAHTFNGDFQSDIALRQASGYSGLWLMSGTTVIGAGGFGAFPLSYQIVGQRDFNGDGKTDWLWRGSDGSLVMWFINGTQATSTSLGTLSPVWTIAGTGDFDGDGNGDILFRDTSGNVAIWLMNGATTKKASILGRLPTSWTMVGVADLNGDGKSDIVLQDTSNNIAIWTMNGAFIASSILLGPVPFLIVGTGDFNGDGKGDILFRNTDGDLAVWLMDGTTVIDGAVLGNLPNSFAISVTGDFDGDGKSDILFRDTSGTGVAAVWYMNGAAVTSGAMFPNPGSDWTFVGQNAN